MFTKWHNLLKLPQAKIEKPRFSSMSQKSKIVFNFFPTTKFHLYTCSAFFFIPFPIETLGGWHIEAEKQISRLGKDLIFTLIHYRCHQEIF